MPRSLILAAVFVSSASAAIWPDRLGDYQRQSVTGSAITGDDRPEWDEYGEKAMERADYGSFKAVAFQFGDTTGAFAASLEPAGRVTSRIGNYLVMCVGACPKNFLKLAEASLPNVSRASLPSLGDYLPEKGRISGSERYVVGPKRLEVNFPQIPESAVAFQFGTEGEVARYRTSAGPVMLAVFSFPTPSIARQQLPEFQKITDATAKRTGPFVVLAIGPPAAAGKLLQAVNYQGVVQENERPPEKPLELKPESAGKMILAILSLAALLLAFCLLSGLAVGGILRFARRFGYSAAEGSLITLHLEGK
jgi:hypothetical protein